MTPHALAEAIVEAHQTGGIDHDLVMATWDLTPDQTMTLGDTIHAANPDAFTELHALRQTYRPTLSWDRENARLKAQADTPYTPPTYDETGQWDLQPPDLDTNPLSPYLIDWADFWHQEPAGEDWLIEPLFARGRGHAVFAGAKTGKSWTVLAACAAAATGRTFLGHTNPPVTVLYVDYEMTADDVRERLEGFGYGPTDDLSRLHYALLVSLPPLNTAEGGMALLRAAQDVGADLVVVDTIGRAVNGEENSNDVIRDFYTHTGKILKREGITVVRLDHAGKNLERGQRGGSAKNDDVDVVWQVGRTDNGQLWTCTHRRMSWIAEQVPIEVTEGDDGIYRFEGQGDVWPAGTAALARELDLAGIPVGMGANRIRNEHPELIEAMKQSGMKTSNKVLHAALRYRKQTFDAGDETSRDDVEPPEGVRRGAPLEPFDIKGSGAPVAHLPESLKTKGGAPDGALGAPSHAVRLHQRHTQCGAVETALDVANETTDEIDDDWDDTVLS